MSRKEYGSTSSFRFDGDLDDLARRLSLEDFAGNTPDRPPLMSAGAGGNGINLAFANHVVLCEPLWNAQDEQQVIDRCHRQPQQMPVYVYRLFGVNSEVDWMIHLSKLKKWNTIRPVMEQILGTKGVPLVIPEIAKWFMPLNDLPFCEPEDNNGCTAGNADEDTGNAEDL